MANQEHLEKVKSLARKQANFSFTGKAINIDAAPTRNRTITIIILIILLINVLLLFE